MLPGFFLVVPLFPRGPCRRRGWLEHSPESPQKWGIGRIYRFTLHGHQFSRRLVQFQSCVHIFHQPIEEGNWECTSEGTVRADTFRLHIGRRTKPAMKIGYTRLVPGETYFPEPTRSIGTKTSLKNGWIRENPCNFSSGRKRAKMGYTRFSPDFVRRPIHNEPMNTHTVRSEVHSPFPAAIAELKKNDTRSRSDTSWDYTAVVVQEGRLKV